eukprot:2210096-Pleurochrysis_carterae.AAC.1
MGGRVLDYQSSDPGSGNPMCWTTNLGNSQDILWNFEDFLQISARPALSRLTELSDLSWFASLSSASSYKVRILFCGMAGTSSADSAASG